VSCEFAVHSDAVPDALRLGLRGGSPDFRYQHKYLTYVTTSKIDVAQGLSHSTDELCRASREHPCRNTGFLLWICFARSKRLHVI
jgi:hypothetical protein